MYVQVHFPRRRHNNTTEDYRLRMDGWTDGRGRAFFPSGRRCITPPPAATHSLCLPVWHSRTGRARIIMRRRRKGKRQKGSNLRVSRQYPGRPKSYTHHSLSQQNIHKTFIRRSEAKILDTLLRDCLSATGNPSLSQISWANPNVMGCKTKSTEIAVTKLWQL